MDIEDIILNLKIISDEVAKLKEEKEDDVSFFNEVGKNAKLAGTYPFSRHILTTKDEVVRQNYIAALLALAEKNEDVDARQQQLLYIYRIIASYDDKICIREYLTKSKKTDSDFWDCLIELFDDETKLCFSVDSLALIMFDYGKAEYEMLSGVLQAFKYSREKVKTLCSIAKIIVEQKVDDFLNMLNSPNSINASYWAGYYSASGYDYIATDFEDVLALSGNVLISNASIKIYDDILDLDKIKAESFEFHDCKFKFIRGMKSSKKVIFKKCTFENGTLPEDQAKNGLSDSFAKKDETASEPFIAGENMEFTECNFKIVTTGVPILELKDSNIISCRFDECDGKKMPEIYLFNFENSLISDTVFYKCSSCTDKENRKCTTGGIIHMRKSTLENCTLEHCRIRGESNFGRGAEYKMYIVRAYNSGITDSYFSFCMCDSCYDLKKNETSYIVGLTDSGDINNTFTECVSEHYNYGDRSGSKHDVGNIEED